VDPVWTPPPNTQIKKKGKSPDPEIDKLFLSGAKKEREQKNMLPTN
jgi:hypothetical protein